MQTLFTKRDPMQLPACHPSPCQNIPGGTIYLLVSVGACFGSSSIIRSAAVTLQPTAMYDLWIHLIGHSKHSGIPQHACLLHNKSQIYKPIVLTVKWWHVLLSIFIDSERCVPTCGHETPLMIKLLRQCADRRGYPNNLREKTTHLVSEM